MPDPERLLEALGRWPALRAIATNEIAQAQATNGALAGLRHADLVAGLEDLGPKAAARQAAGNAWSAGELAEKIFTFGRSAKLKRERSPATPDAAVDDEPPRQRTHDPEYAERIRKHQLALVARHEQAKVPDPAKVAEFERLQRLAEEL